MEVDASVSVCNKAFYKNHFNSPFTLKAKGETELQRLGDADVLYSVPSSEYKTPILAVIKKCGSVRI